MTQTGPVAGRTADTAEETGTPVSATRTISVRRLPGLLLSGALVAGLALSLTACGHRPGSAAVVNGRRISVTELQEATASLRATDPTNFGKVPIRTVLAILIVAPYAQRAASDAGSGVSDDVARQAVASQAQQNGSTNVHLEKLNAGALDALRTEVAFNDLTTTEEQQAFIKTVAGLHVQVSPRYGTFDKQNLTVIAGAPNWLPKPKATPTATPSATG
jgi:hypothetical protein